MQRSRSSEIAGEIGIGFSSVRFSNVMRVLPGPKRNVRSCSGHSPPLSQTGQSSGWLTRMNSSVASCASRASSDAITSATVRALVLHATWRRSANPESGTRNEGSWRVTQALGSRCASGSRGNALFDHGRVRVLVDGREQAVERRLAAERAAALLDVAAELIAELVDVARDRHRRRVAERTEALAEDPVADVEQEVELG